MEGMLGCSAFVEYISRSLSPEIGDFCLVDIGCSGGMDREWEGLGRRLKAVGVDPIIAEIDRLRNQNTNQKIRYVCGNAVLPDDHPLRNNNKGSLSSPYCPWNNLACVRSAQNRQAKKVPPKDDLKKLEDGNFWQSTSLSTERIFVPQWLEQNGYESVDFLKIDIDGLDFDVLRSFDGFFDTFGILGVGIEVNYINTGVGSMPSFFLISEYLLQQGFSLYGTTLRKYAHNALPARYLQDSPTQSVSGRIVQGDAVFLRDMDDPRHISIAPLNSPTKLMNAATIAALFGYPDTAAAIIDLYRPQLEQYCNVGDALDALALQMQEYQDGKKTKKMTYSEYMKLFEKDDRYFYFLRYGVKENIRKRFGSFVRRLLKKYATAF